MYQMASAKLLVVNNYRRTERSVICFVMSEIRAGAVFGPDLCAY
jgi:hypothetical protein